jgi:hypothetical protein
VSEPERASRNAPATGTMPSRPRERAASDRDEFLPRQRRVKAFIRLVHLAPVRQRLHPADPGADVAEVLERAAHQLAQGDHLDADVVGQGDRVAAQPGVAAAEEVRVEHAQPAQRLLASPRDGVGMPLFAGALVVREQLRIDQAVGVATRDGDRASGNCIAPYLLALSTT